jgi:DNA-binding GntR family transcriptional regulator
MFSEDNSISHKIYKYLEKAIRDESLKPGEKLVENNLAKKLGVSRPPIREAFRLLQKDGLVTVFPRRGAYVSQVTAKDAEDIYAIRAYLEPLAVHLSLRHFKKNDFSFFERLLKEMEVAVEENDFDTFRKLNNKFHNKFFEKTNNPKLNQLYEMFGKQIERFRSTAYRVPIRLKRSLHEHQMIYTALRNQDLPLTEILVRDHIENAGNDLIAYLKSLKEEEKP